MIIGILPMLYILLVLTKKDKLLFKFLTKIGIINIYFAIGFVMLGRYDYIKLRYKW